VFNEGLFESAIIVIAHITSGSRRHISMHVMNRQRNEALRHVPYILLENDPYWEVGSTGP